jgi:type IV pilus assembly protein PilO
MRARGREVYIIAGIVAIVLVVAWYFLLFSPKQSEMSDLQDQIDTQQTTLATAQQEVVRLESYKKTAPQSRAEIVRLGKMLPQTEGIPSLIIELSRTADASGVDLTTITRGTTLPGSPYGVQAVTIQVVGRFFDVEDFVYRLENYVAFRNASFRVTGRLLEIQNISMAPGSATDGSTPPVSTTIALNAYLWGLPGAPAAPAAGGAQ